MADVDPNNGGLAIIENGQIVIRVAIDALPVIVEGAWASNDGSLFGGKRYQVTDPGAFAADLVRELNNENEVGTTRIHKMFDGAVAEAIDQGAFGIEEHPDQDGD